MSSIFAIEQCAYACAHVHAYVFCLIFTRSMYVHALVRMFIPQSKYMYVFANFKKYVRTYVHAWLID